MTNYLIDKLVAWAQKTPYFDLPGYMERWWVRQPKPGRKWTCRIHHILSSDTDRHLHDHPWPYVTIILRGGYWEVAPISHHKGYKMGYGFNNNLTYDYEFGHAGMWVEKKWHGPGSVLIRKPDSFHKLILPEGKTALTMFWIGPHKQPWGFMTREGKVFWREYLNDWESSE